MLVKDEAKLGQHAAMRRRENQRQQIAEWVDRQEEQAQFVDSPDIGALDTMKKMGKIMMVPEFEARLKRMLPNIVFVGKPGFPGRKAKYPTPGGEWVDLGSYHADWLPERTIREPIEQFVPIDRKALSDSTAPVMDIDLSNRPKRAWVPIDDPEIAEFVGLTVDQMKALWEPDGKGAGQWVDLEPDESYKGRKITIPGKIKRKGWRAPLVCCVKLGLATPTEVENHFGLENTVEWKQHLGRGPMIVPW